MRLVAHQIVDIQATPFVGVLNQPPQGNANHRIASDDNGHARSIGEYLAHARQIIRWKLRPQLAMYAFGLGQPFQTVPFGYMTRSAGDGNDAQFRCHAACDTPPGNVRSGQPLRADHLRTAEKPDGSGPEKAN